MPSSKKICIFVDGENLRHAIGDLFLNFNKDLYLPKTNWTNFFDWIASKAVRQEQERIRTYWYVVQNIDFTPFNLNSARKNEMLLEELLLKDKERSGILSRTKEGEKSEIMHKMADELEEIQATMQRRFSGWINIQDAIAHRDNAIEFRRSGSIRYNLFEKSLGSEKAVDVKLATDLIKLKDIYDVAVIVSGDQDYVPAVDAIKDFGKHTVNVAFLTQNNRLLPGGARRLNQSTDWSIEIGYLDAKTYLGL